MTQNVFTYGSLMFDQVWSRVVQGRYSAQKATLRGYRRLAVKGEEYPAAISAPEYSMTGVVYLGVTAADVRLLDEFEGEYYARLSVPTMLESGAELAAEVYVLKQQFAHIAAPMEWDVEYFRRVGIEKFIARYQGFRQ